MKEKLEKVKGSLTIISWDSADERLRKHAINSIALLDSIISMLDSPWQPIESAPKDGTEILATDGSIMAVVYWDEELRNTTAPSFWAFPNGFALDALQATHWMPLPAAIESIGGKDNG